MECAVVVSVTWNIFKKKLSSLRILNYILPPSLKSEFDCNSEVISIMTN